MWHSDICMCNLVTYCFSLVSTKYDLMMCLQYSAKCVQVRIDAAFALWYRDVLENKQGPIYLWCDSSPQLGADWLLSIFDHIHEEHVVACWENATALFCSVKTFQTAFEDGDHDQMADQVLLRHEANQFLQRHVKRHRQMPMSLGSGASSLEDKARALALKFSRETHNIQSLRAICNQVCSLTVDMGVEGGLADAVGGDVCEYLPPWMRGTSEAQLLPDEGIEALEIQQVQESNTHLFPRAFLSTGLDHVSNNLQNDLDKQLPGWDDWLAKFKALSNLLSKRHLLQRLVGRCMLNTPFEPLKRMFETVVPSCAKWRWGTIVKSLPEVLRLHRPLSIVWNKAKFLGNSSEEQNLENANAGDDTLDLDVVTAAVQSPFWLAYGHMILQLHEVANHVSAWGSGCKCHEWLRKSKDVPTTNPWEDVLLDTAETLGLEKLADGSSFQCPLAGKRAPEIANGDLVRSLDERIDLAHPKVLVESSVVSGGQQEQIINDFNLGIGYIKLVLELKLGHWSDFPWVFCKLLMPGDVKRQQEAAALLEAFDKLPSDTSNHHRITTSFLGPGVLREQFEALATGTPLKNLQELSHELCRLCFIPVVERIAEGEHSIIHRHGGYRKITGAYVSCAQRLPEIEEVFRNTGFKPKLLDAFEQTRKIRKLANLFNFTNHPQWSQQVCKPKREQTGLDKLANAIMYSCDVATQFMDMSIPRKKQDAAERARKKVETSILAAHIPRQRISAESVLNHALVDHMSDCLRPGSLYSMPADIIADGAVASLEVARCFPVEDRGASLARDASIETDLGEFAGPAQAGERPHVFFKVLTTTASRLKTVKRAPASKLRLKKGDIAITIHKADFDVASGCCLVESNPHKCSDAGNLVHIMSGLGLCTSKIKEALVWQHGQDVCHFTLPQASSLRHASVIQQFVAASAFEGRSEQKFIQSNPLSRAILQELQGEGWAVQSERGWQLTQAAVKQLRVSQKVRQPSILLEEAPDHVPLMEQSIWQLCMKLQSCGWSWKRSSPKIALPPYVEDGARVWYTGGLTVKKEYVLCLLEAPKVLALDAECVIHHNKSVKYYKHLLEGEYQLACEVLDQEKNQRPIIVQACLEDSSNLGMIADEGIAWQLSLENSTGDEPQQSRGCATRKRKRENAVEHVEVDSDGESIPSLSSFGRWVDSEVDDDDIDGGGDDGAGGGAGNLNVCLGEEAVPNVDNADVPASSSVPLDLPPSGPSDPASSQHAGEENNPESRDSAVGVTRLQRPETIPSWGNCGFRITWRAPGGAAPNGAFQGTCVFHRHSSKNRCTRSINVSDNSAESRDMCLRQIKNWLIQAPAFDRAWKHRGWNPRSFETPSSAVLEAKANDLPAAPVSVQHDQEIDAASEVAPKAKAKGKGKSQPKKNAKPKSKPADGNRSSEPKAKPMPANPKSDSDSSLSLTTSSSSSSSSSS